MLPHCRFDPPGKPLNSPVKGRRDATQKNE
jgi:hypothetical protein